MPQERVETHYVPIGVIGAIAPWNYPILLAGFKIGPALLTGNTVVLKPSRYTPLTTLKIGELARGLFPHGLLNVISGGDSLGRLMTKHTGFDKVSFIGSTHTGRVALRSGPTTFSKEDLVLKDAQTYSRLDRH